VCRSTSEASSTHVELDEIAPDGARAVLGRGAHPASDHLGFDRQPLEGGEEVGPPGRRRLLRPPDVATARSSTVELVAIGDPVPADSRTT